MTAADLGTKRQCPKCGAKFYDFGADNPITCPKCAHAWKEKAEEKAKPAKVKKEKAEPARKKPVIAADDDLPDDLPAIEDDGGLEDLEPMEDEEVEMASLEEVEEHDDEEIDPNSDDADDEMFTDMVGEERLVDDLDEYIETDADHEDEDDEDEEE